jgi:hypothetical protein
MDGFLSIQAYRGAESDATDVKHVWLLERQRGTNAHDNLVKRANGAKTGLQPGSLTRMGGGFCTIKMHSLFQSTSVSMEIPRYSLSQWV